MQKTGANFGEVQKKKRLSSHFNVIFAGILSDDQLKQKIEFVSCKIFLLVYRHTIPIKRGLDSLLQTKCNNQ